MDLDRRGLCADRMHNAPHCVLEGSWSTRCGWGQESCWSRMDADLWNGVSATRAVSRICVVLAEMRSGGPWAVMALGLEGSAAQELLLAIKYGYIWWTAADPHLQSVAFASSLSSIAPSPNPCCRSRGCRGVACAACPDTPSPHLVSRLALQCSFPRSSPAGFQRGPRISVPSSKFLRLRQRYHTKSV